MELWETDSAIDEFNECDDADQSIAKFGSKRSNSNIKLTESSSSGIVVENDSSKHSHENKLSELEQQVEDAEVRCGTLQQQLEFMRLLYKNKLVENIPLDSASDEDENSLTITNRNKFSAQNNFSEECDMIKLNLQYNANIIEKSSPRGDDKEDPLSEESGLFYAADQNFMEDLNGDYFQESSLSNNLNLQNENEMYEYENRDILQQNLTCESNCDQGRISENEDTCEYESVLENEVGSEHQIIFESKNDLISENISELDNNYEDQYTCTSEYENIPLHRNHTELETIFENENLRLNNVCALESNSEFDMNCEIENNFELENSCDVNYCNSESQCVPSENLGIERSSETITSCILENTVSYNIHIDSNSMKEENVTISDSLVAYADHTTHNQSTTNDHIIDSSSGISKKGGTVNPVQAIKGLLSGLTDSVNIITKLNTSESIKNKFRPLSRMDTKSDTSLTTLKTIQSTVTMRSSQSKCQKSSTSFNKTCLLPQAPQGLFEQSEQQLLNYDSVNIEYEPTNIKDEQLKDIDIKESEHQLHDRHHHHRYHNGSRRHHHHDDNKHEISTSEDTTQRMHFRKYKKDVFDTYSLKPRHSYHKDLANLHCQSHHSLNTVDLPNNSGQECRKIHKKKEISRRKHRKLEKKNWNDFGSDNIDFPHYEKYKNSEYDSLSVTTHKNKKHKKYSKSLILDEDLDDVCPKEHVKGFRAKLKYINENPKHEPKENEELMTNKVISSEKHKRVNKNEKNKSLSTFLENNNVSPPAELNPKSVNETYCKALAPKYEETPNFAVPTVSSRLKQNDKPILQFFNFRNIPFVVGTSTSRSHNLALNLQQALSIIKLRNPSGPVLGDLTTEVGSSILSHSSRPSTAGSVSGHKVFCPVAMAQMRNPKLQIADNNESQTPEDRSERAQSAETEPLPGTFESLLKSQAEVENVGRICFPQLKQKENVWDVEQADENQNNLNSKLRCTCFPNRPCINYQKLLYEYLHQEKETYLQVLLKSQREKQSSYQCKTKSAITEIPRPKEQLLEYGEDNEGNPVYGQIQAHSKGLREVLLNMHRDFLRLSHKYEYLQSEVENQNVEGFDAAKELGKLEDELGAKENDIMVVMGLYKELTTLKQQVKALKAKTNSQHIITKSQSTNSHEPTVSIRLTRLLRTIQKFQEKLLQD